MIKIIKNVKEFFVCTYHLFFGKSINGKEHIEQYMTEKYGEDWLDQCMEGLRNPQVREQLREDLNL